MISIVTNNYLEVGCLYEVTEQISFRLPENPNADSLVFSPKTPWIRGLDKIIMPLEKDVQCLWQYSSINQVVYTENTSCMKLLVDDKIFYFVCEATFYDDHPELFKRIRV